MSETEAQLQSRLQAARNAAALAERRRVVGLGMAKPSAVSRSAPSGSTPTPEMLAGSVRLSNGEWVSKDIFYKLSEEDQNRLMRSGIKAYNNYYAQKEIDFRTNNVQLKDGSWVTRELYDSLNADDKTLLSSIGIEKFSKQKEADYEIFKSQNIQLSDGSWIAKADYDNLPTAWRGIVEAYGVTGFQDWLKTAYGGASELVQVTKPDNTTEIYGKTSDPNIGLDAGGNRFWIGGRWPDSTSTALSKGVILTSRWPTEVSTFQPITPLTHIKLDTGEWITKEEFKAVGEISKEGQQILQQKGLVSYQDWIIEQIESEQKKLEADYIQLPEAQMMLKTDFEQLSPEYQKIVKEQGYSAYIAEVKKNTVELKSGELMDKSSFEALPAKMQEAAMANGLGAIDISQLKPEEQFEKMKQWDMVDKDAKFGGVNEDGEILIETSQAEETVKEAWYRKFMTAEFAKGAAIGMVPIAGTMYFWKVMKPWERGLSIALDVATLIPIVGGISVGVRAGRGVAASVGRVLLAEVKAPITLITRPIATAKSVIRPVKVLLSAKKLPLAAAELRTSSIFFDAEKVGSAKSAMQARDTLTEAAIMGREPSIIIEGKKIELAKTALNQKGVGLGIHTAPDIRAFMSGGAEIRANKEGFGMFVDSSLHSDYTPASALGHGLTPSPDVSIWEIRQRTVDKIGKYHPQDILGLDRPTFRSLNFADATAIPADLAAPMKKIVQEEKGILFGSFVEHLKSPGAKLPHDADMGFPNPRRAQTRLVDMAKSRGYNAVPVGEAIGVITKGKYAKANYAEFERIVNSSKGKEFLKQLELSGEMNKLGDVKGMDKINEFYETHGLKSVGYDEIDGIRVTKLGEQYLRQAFGAIDPTLETAKHAKRVMKVKLMAGQIEDLIKDAGFTKKMPGALLIRDEKLLQAMQPSGKITRYGIELEQTIPFGKLSKPSQILEMYSPAGETIYLAVIGKPFTAAELAKFKLMGAIDTIRDIFRPVLKIDNEAVKTMDKMNQMAAEARNLEKAIKAADEIGDAAQGAKLRARLSQVNSESRAIARMADAQNAARVGIRMGAVTTGDFIDSISYREIARTKPTELARVLADISRADRTKILGELDRVSRARIEREISSVSRLPRTEISRLTRIVPERISERAPTRTAERISERVPERIAERLLERVPTRVPTRALGGIPTRVPARLITTIPEPIVPSPIVSPKIATTTTIKLPNGDRLELTKDQMNGVVAWKQGKLKRKGGILKPLYWLKYPDLSGRYPVKNTIHTFDPVEGVKYAEGPGSVQKSIVKKYGELSQEKIIFDMGIQDVVISRDSKKGTQQPRIEFKLDYLRDLTEKQKEGIVAWKSGFMYWLKYPDKQGKYPDENTKYSKKPIEGVKYYDGIGSAAKSIIAKYGRIPEDLKFSMGIQDVRISASQIGKKPKIEFKLRSKHYRAKQKEAAPSLIGVR